ncbi:SET domain [Trinorchestia longiramus]|nr:SET domain [Trinorchestia longiramus]
MLTLTEYTWLRSKVDYRALQALFWILLLASLQWMKHSNIMPTLKTITKKFKERLESENDFGKLRSVSEKFQYLWEFNKKNPVQLPNVTENINKKNAELSEAFRNEGNRLYRQKKLQKALEAYNIALIAAPHPQDANEYDNKVNELPYEGQFSNGEFSHLSYAYANRSALLYELNEYERAMMDISAATACGYPKSKQHKLWERRIKCLISLEKFKEAHSSALLLEAKLTNFPMDAKELKTFKADLSKLLSKCCVAENGQNNSPKNQTTQSNFSKISSGSSKSVTEQSRKRATTFCQNNLRLTVPVQTSRNCKGTVSSAVGVQCSESKGRHLVALRDISPGEILLVEDSHVYYMKLNSCLRSHCHHCLRQVYTPTPCITCSLAVFCDSSCRRAAEMTRGGHASECAQLPTLVALQPDLDACLALHAITALGWHNFSKCAQQIDSNDSGVCNSFTDTRDQVEAARRDSDPHCTSDTDSLAKLLDIEELDYQFLTSLEGNLSSRCAEELIEAGIYALILLKVLISNAAFWKSKEHCTDPALLQTSDFITLGCHLMVMMLKIQCNAHCIKELEIKSNEPQQQCSYLDVGYGLYQKLSLLNHSCNANAHQSSMGKQKILYSISSIARSEEITISYGERFASHRKENRIKSLGKAYHFICNCRACANDWPLFQDLPMKFSLRCYRCNSAVDPSSKKCRSCQLEHSTGGSNGNKKNKGKKGKKGAQKESVHHVYDVSSCNIQIMDAWKQYNEAFKNIEKGTTDAQDLQKITELISLMDKYALMPNKPYVEAQETCIRWFDVYSIAAQVHE